MYPSVKEEPGKKSDERNEGKQIRGGVVSSVAIRELPGPRKKLIARIPLNGYGAHVTEGTLIQLERGSTSKGGGWGLCANARHEIAYYNSILAGYRLSGKLSRTHLPPIPDSLESSGVTGTIFPFGRPRSLAPSARIKIPSDDQRKIAERYAMLPRAARLAPRDEEQVYLTLDYLFPGLTRFPNPFLAGLC